MTATLRKSTTRVAAEEAAVLFEHFGWTWSVRDGKTVRPYVPTVDEIESHLIDQTEQIYSDPHTVSSETGRLKVVRADMDNGMGTCYYLFLAETNVYSGEAMA